MIDAHFVLRTMALIRSLERQGTSFRLWILCTDDASFALFDRMKIPSVSAFSLREVETAYPELPAVKPQRGSYEYIATSKPFLLRSVLDRLSEGTLLTYLDGDLWFFSSPDAIAREIGASEILLTPHGFPEHLHSKLQNGLFNAGFCAATKTPEGAKAVQWWCDRCIEWCHDRVEDGKFSNQKYLEQVPRLFRNVKIATHPGLNVAPWNLDTHRYAWDGTNVLVDGRPLVFYHFHGLKLLKPWLYDTGLATYHMEGSSLIATHIYAPYIRELRQLSRWLKQEHGFEAGLGSVRTKDRRTPLSFPLMASRVRRRQWLVSL
ncbi:MAG: family 2 glycosyl transferase [Candidatus Peregrinibacteria bacterium Greene0416_19]|nr:MAG: family 2 glycosyl transferase [Candidatus Peregrinibacteria bacterium Greene0416_19]